MSFYKFSGRNKPPKYLFMSNLMLNLSFLEIVDFVKFTKCLESMFIIIYTEFYKNKICSFDLITFKILFLIFRKVDYRQK